MRKELVIYLPTTERGVEVSIRTLKGDSSALLISHETGKFAVPVNELVEAIKYLDQFNLENSNGESQETTDTSTVIDVTYGEEDA